MKNFALILASGDGVRVGGDVPKQFLKLGDKTILEHSIQVFEKNHNIDAIIVVAHPTYLELTTDIIAKSGLNKVIKIISGGKSRRESTFNGISSINKLEGKILIHDSVRPFVNDKMINECLAALDKSDAACVAVPTTDTLLQINEDCIVENVPERRKYLKAQTPQAFKLTTIRKAHELAKNTKGTIFTDDCGLVCAYKLAKIHIIQGDEKNIKITYPEDMQIAADYLKLIER